MIFKCRRNAHVLYALAENRLHLLKQSLVFLRLFFGSLLFFFGLHACVFRRNVLEALAFVLLQHHQRELVHIVRKVQHLVAAVKHGFGLRQMRNALRGLARRVVNAGLVFLHVLNVLFQRAHLACGGAEQHKILELILVDAVVLIHAEFESQTETLKELLVVLSVVLQHGFKLRRNLLLNARRDKF